MAQSFDLRTVRTSSATAYLRLEGDLNAASAAAVERLVSLHSGAGRIQIRLDASSAVVVDDEALNVLADIALQLRRAGGALTMQGAQRQRLFRKTDAVSSYRQL